MLYCSGYCSIKSKGQMYVYIYTYTYIASCEAEPSFTRLAWIHWFTQVSVLNLCMQMYVFRGKLAINYIMKNSAYVFLFFYGIPSLYCSSLQRPSEGDHVDARVPHHQSAVQSTAFFAEDPKYRGRDSRSNIWRSELKSSMPPHFYHHHRQAYHSLTHTSHHIILD